MANGYSSDNTSDEHCAGGSSGGLIRLQGDQVIHPTSGFPLLRPVALASSADNILLDLHNYLSILLDLHNYLSNSSDHTQPGAQENHDSERATFMRSCHGVFTNRFVFKTVLARILIIF